MHRQNANALKARIPPQVGLGEPVVVCPSGPYGVIPVDETADALAGGRKKNGILEPDFIHELSPPFGSRILKPTVWTNANGPRWSSRQRELDVALAREHAAPEARRLYLVGKMPSNGFGVLKNVAVTINDIRLLFHRILMYRPEAVRSFYES